MIQDIHPHQFENKYLNNPELTPDDYIFHFKESALLLKQTGETLEIPRRKDLKTDNANAVFLFTLNKTNCFLVWTCTEPSDQSFSYQEINFFRNIPQQEIAWTSIVAFHLMTWYAQNKFCGRCGSTTTCKTDERAITCPSCKHTVYPKISPAIIVGIICGDKILLARGVNYRSPFYSLIAGYADIGESLEDAVRREVKEEVGLDVWNIRYYTSQPWPYSGSMMIGYIAEADDQQPIKLEQKELIDAIWFSRDQLPNHPSNISISGEIIEKFKNREL